MFPWNGTPYIPQVNLDRCFKSRRCCKGIGRRIPVKKGIIYIKLMKILESQPDQFLGIPFLVWILLCLMVAFIYSFIYPKIKSDKGNASLRQQILRWGHSLVWYILAVSFLLRMIDGVEEVVADIVAWSGFVVYIVFIITLFWDRVIDTTANLSDKQCQK